MRRATEQTVQHRRHRAVYLAPTAVDLQHFSSSNKSYDSLGNDSYENDDEQYVEDLRIPLFVEIPHDENLRLPITSPPCSGGSHVEPLVSPVFSSYEYQVTHQEERWHTESPRGQPHRRRGRVCQWISTVYAVVSDFCLLIFVCLMGLFFHVEVQVVKERAHGRRGRVVAQKGSARERRRRRRHEYRSTDLLRPLEHNSPSNSYLTPDDMV